MYDTPGLLHPYLMSIRLNRDEQKMIEIRKELQPRSFRIKARQSIHIGALMRLDLNQATTNHICHSLCITEYFPSSWEVRECRGNLDKACRYPAAASSWQGSSVRTRTMETKRTQDYWSELGCNSTDIAAAGLGWISIGLKGEANATLWSYDGVEITLREPLVLDRAPFLERPGFLLPKAILDAIGNQSKLEAEKERNLKRPKNANLITGKLCVLLNYLSFFLFSFLWFSMHQKGNDPRAFLSNHVRQYLEVTQKRFILL
ncbi:hypothetical protein MKX01_006697 [Papaver californicum]|nr:hypothetical protein MKX01_006697 [Papaver californicum]